ncbi:MAG TPA: hypothetical protein VFX07_12495 [Candidatus Udaeobacter sp.]|nr:hypothetical protein [Candidatus Udaeobacter sp.]
MRPLLCVGIMTLCVGCAPAKGPFVQDGIRIVPPVMQEGHGNIEKITKYNDGGTTLIKIADAKGKKFDVYFDHRIGTKTPGAVYLIDYPDKSTSVLVVNQQDFRRKIPVFE